MSELRIGLVAEGPTDGIVIEAALRAILGRPFVLQVIQPEVTRPGVGTGWCGVLKWCREFAARSCAGLEEDPTLPGFDLFVVHADADVADRSYADCGTSAEHAARALPPLPCSSPCPPAHAAADAVRARLIEWLGIKQLGPRTVLCVPSKAIESWLAAGVLHSGHPLLNDLECNLGLDGQLAALPKTQRLRKSQNEYRRHATSVTTQWARITQACTQAQRFQQETLGAMPA